MNISLVVFDLDGTLISSHETIYQATVEALRRIGIKKEIDQNKFNTMIGWHFEDIFKVYDFKVPDFEDFINIYKSIYFDYIHSSYLYDGVKKTLEFLQAKKISTALLTTKGQDQAEILVNFFDIGYGLNYIMGRRPGIAHKPSPEPLLKICQDLNVDNSNTLIVGDTEMDIECGRNAGARTCAVSYGYRTAEELKALSPDFLIDNIAKLEYIVNGL